MEAGRRVSGSPEGSLLASRRLPPLAYPGAQIFSFDSTQIKEVAYEKTTHYKIYKQFFTDRNVFLDDTQIPNHE